MKIRALIILITLVILITNPVFAQNSSPELSYGFNQCLSRCTGLTALSEKVAECKIKSKLQEFASGDFDVYLDAFSAQDLRAGKFRSLVIMGKNVSVKEFFLTYIKLYTVNDYNYFAIDKNPPIPLVDEKIGFQAIISQEDLRKTAKGKLYDEILKKLSKDYDFSAFKLDSDSVKIENNTLQFKVNLDSSILGEDKAAVVESDFEIKDGQFERLKISLANLNTSLDKDELSSIFPQINNLDFPLEAHGIKSQIKIINAKIVDNNIVIVGEVFVQKKQD